MSNNYDEDVSSIIGQQTERILQATIPITPERESPDFFDPRIARGI